MRHEDIALAIGISAPTLEKHYAVELSTGAAGRRLEVLQALFASAKKGSSSAAKAYMALEPELAAPPAAKERPLGKKEQAQVDAESATVGTEWADILPDGVVPIRQKG